MSEADQFSCRRVFGNLEGDVTGFKVADDEQVIVMKDGVALALHKLLGGMSLNAYREKGLSDDEGASLSRLCAVLF